LLLLKQTLAATKQLLEDFADSNNARATRLQTLRLDQRRSRFNNNPLLHERDVLLQMLGKGGFSEVYKAF
jgi:tousled-like kinase